MKTRIITIALLGIIGWAGWGYEVGHPHVVAGETREVPAVMKFSDFPFLMKICNAESGGTQFKKNGDVVRGKVNPSDIGKCQINEQINNDQARRMGYDIFTEKGNEDMAIWLYLNQGTKPWDASKGMWSN